MAEALEEANQGLNQTLKDLFAGAVGGVAQVLIGMISSPLYIPARSREGGDALCSLHFATVFIFYSPQKIHVYLFNGSS